MAKSNADGKRVYYRAGYDGKHQQVVMDKGRMTFYKDWDDNGFLSGLRTVNNSSDFTQFDMTLSYDANTGNLLSRTGMYPEKEQFGYDALDRLTTVKLGNDEIMSVKYSENGNILSKSDVGDYEYGLKPHAVMSVENPKGIIPSATLSTQFNEFGKISRIEDGNTLQSLKFNYGPDSQRWSSKLSRNGAIVSTRVYFDDYEKTLDSEGTHEIFYLNDYALMKRDNGGDYNLYYISKDNLGSIVKAYDAEGGQVYSATYDAWGKQTVTQNAIGLYRGYCGHEMLNDFDIINMNGRLYDPVLGRFFSPDNYVQMPDNSQNFNRYSYCLNNPLKYTDPSGEIFSIDDFLFFSIASGAMMGAMNAEMSGKSVWSGTLVGALGNAATYGVGSLFGPVGSFGHEALRAGAHGLSTGLFNGLTGQNAFLGLISGFGSSLLGSFSQSVHLPDWALMTSTAVMGGAVSWVSGGDIFQGVMNGLQIGAFNFAEHNITYKHDSQGHIYGTIKDVVIYPNNQVEQYSRTAGIYSALATSMTILKGANDYLGKCRVGTNGKLYLPKIHGQFYGNQYVRTRQLKGLSHLGAFEKIFAVGEDYANLQALYIADGNQFGTNCQRYVAQVIGRELGSKGGRFLGRFLGGVAGSGAASIPLSIGGGIAGDYFGGEFGAAIGGYIYDIFK